MKLIEHSRMGFSATEDSGIHEVVKDVSYGGFMPALSIMSLDAHFLQNDGHPDPPIAGADDQIMHCAEDLGFILVYAPDLSTLFEKFPYHMRDFYRSSSNAVKHETSRISKF